MTSKAAWPLSSLAWPYSEEERWGCELGSDRIRVPLSPPIDGRKKVGNPSFVLVAHLPPQPGMKWPYGGNHSQWKAIHVVGPFSSHLYSVLSPPALGGGWAGLFIKNQPEPEMVELALSTKQVDSSLSELLDSSISLFQNGGGDLAWLPGCNLDPRVLGTWQTSELIDSCLP